MSNYNFDKDIVLGHEAEDIVLDILHKHGHPEAYRVIGPDCKHDIIVPRANKSIEVKCDILAAKTGNLAIETGGRYGRPSGITSSKANYYVILADGEIFMIDRLQLLNYIQNTDFPVVSGGDDNATTMTLVPIQLIRTQKFCRMLG